MRHRRWTFIPAWFLLAGLDSASGTTLKKVGLEELVESSGLIFHGLCTGMEAVDHRVSGISVVRYTFQVIDGVKGVQVGEALVVSQLAGSSWLKHLPRYQPGHEYVLFLYPASRLGLMSPVGMGQGAFQVIFSGSGPPTLVNGFRNRNLAVEGRTNWARTAGPGGRSMVDDGISLDELLERARDLVRRASIHRGGRP